MRNYWQHVKKLVTAAVFFTMCYIYLEISHCPHSRSRLPASATHNRLDDVAYSDWPPFNPQSHDQEWYRLNCFQNQRNDSIERLVANLKLWDDSLNPHCKFLLATFHRIYALEESEGEVQLPKPFQRKVSKWLGGVPNAIAMVLKQKMIHIVNKYTRQWSIHTPLRSKRPKAGRTELGKDSLQYVTKIANETRSSCDFCNFEQFTALDTFGRIETPLSFTASNVFKMNRWHGLIVPKKHCILNLTESDVTDVFSVAGKWFDAANAVDRRYRFPMVSWDNLAHAGASQFHPHLQAFLDDLDYYGAMGNLRLAAQLFSYDFESNYFTDVVLVHEALGLAVQSGNAWAFVELTERGDGEFVIVSAKPNADFYRLVYLVVRTFIEELQVYSFTAGFAFPILGESKGSLPAIARLTTRGEADNIFSEISGFDLYLSPNTSRDPYTLIARLRKLIQQYKPEKSIWKRD